MRQILAAVGLLLVLGGCTQIASNAIQDYNDVRKLARDYVGEQVRYRILMREDCFRMVMLEARDLEAAGDPAAARALLAKAYPPIMTVEAITGGDVKAALETINEARICGAGPKPPAMRYLVDPTS